MFNLINIIPMTCWKKERSIRGKSKKYKVIR